ncbi:MAG: hypothetical protein PVTTEEND_001737, partial [Candidatus Fervidibacter sp.]
AAAPAGAKAWGGGVVKGLRARGGFEVDILWRDGQLKGATIRSHLGGVCRVRTPVPVKVVGAKTREPKGEVANPLLKPQPPAPFTAPERWVSSRPDLPTTFITEFETKANRTYRVQPL